jgi:hypothetical protein
MRDAEAKDSLFEPSQALWLLSSFCTLYQKSLDTEALARECVPPFPVDALIRLAAGLGLEAEVVRLKRPFSS